MGKTKVTLDTNVLVSALGWNGKPCQILEKVVNELFISYDQLEELSKVKLSQV
jgi:predicted nucleic acid-binding protein